MERFDAYMERCLYGTGGFYRSHGVAGRRRGDFITSPEIGPLFGAVLTQAIDQWWIELGRPDDFTVYDVGAGPGTLLRSVRRALDLSAPDRPWRLVDVDRAHGSGGRSEPGAELPDDLSSAVVVANELLDNLPFRVLIAGDTPGRWRELYVDDGSEVEQGVPAHDRALALVDVDPGMTRLAPGTRVPVLESANAWVSDLLGRNPSRLVVFDYGAPSTVELAERGGWLRTYRGHHRGHDPLIEPGRWDITTDIAVDQLPRPDVVSSQREFLTRAGMARLVEEGRVHWRATAHRPDTTALMMRSRISEAEALLDPDGLGSWLVLEWESPS